ncbi:SusC/RagA family TonB-linked outer membrane protein [Leeuwenhoekiella sp. LLG6367-2.1]|uniref:SusC/RagA family TonB-linked outer membrane protein n=1 Tax=Leeuwenhoekiella sp. LLG6367-2.1 TaxID=3160833 RepID=UPI0038638905
MQQFATLFKLKRNRFRLTFIFTLLLAISGYTQQNTVTGVVTSSLDGMQLPGVNVMERGTSNGVVTGLDGDYTIKVSAEAVLVFSYVGFKTQEVIVNKKTKIDVQLDEDMESLDDIVLVGYGSQRKEDITSAVSSVDSEEFVKGNVNDIGQLLQGKVAGLSVSMTSGDPRAGSQVRLRGTNSIIGSSSPLILIDGIPGDFRTVAPEDIESVDVLKDGSAAAIYGTRGTNGVILITTKRASGSYTNRVDYSVNLSTQQIANQLEVLSADDYRRQIEQGVRDPSQDFGSSTDWLDAITRTPFSQVHNLTFRGGNATTNYLATINYRGLEGVFLKSNNETFSGRVDINHNMFDDKLKFNFGLISRNQNNTTTTDQNYTYRQALLRNPTEPIYDEDGNWFERPGNFDYENPLARIYESDGEERSLFNRFNAQITYEPVTDLKINALGSLGRYYQTRGYSETKNHISTIRNGLNGYVSNGTRETQEKLLELTAQYSKSLEKHNLTLLGGYSYQESYYRDYSMTNRDFPTDEFSYHNIGLGNGINEGDATVGGYTSTSNLIGFFGRLNYNFDDKYLLMASVRHEAASQLYRTKKPWGTFPAVSAGWRLSQESFLKDVDFLYNLKIRAGYGVTGTPNGGGFGAVPLLGYGSYFYYNGEWIRTLVPSQNPNLDLKWEEKHETNLGLDFGFLENRISGSIDYYVRDIHDLLYDYSVPTPPNLYPTTRANVGKMKNEGLEVALNFVPVQNQNFEWTSNMNFSTNTNKLISLSNDLYQSTNDYFTAGYTGPPVQTFTHIIEIGGPVGNFYGFKVTGLDENGLWIYETPEGETQSYDEFDHSFENKQILGNGLPKYYASFNNSFRYKKLDLSITMRGAFDYQILNFERMYLENSSIKQYNRLATSEDAIFGSSVALNAPEEFNSYYLENGDFWKIDNITIGYNFDEIGKYIKSARLSFSTLNTFTFTNYKGIDPEVNRGGLDPGNDGRDKYPTTRTFTLGLNVSF